MQKTTDTCHEGTPRNIYCAEGHVALKICTEDTKEEMHSCAVMLVYPLICTNVFASVIISLSCKLPAIKKSLIW